MTTPLTARELAELRSVLAHENDPPVDGIARSMDEAIIMRRNGYDSVTIVDDNDKPRCRISNGGPPRVFWDSEGPRLLANLDAMTKYARELEERLKLLDSTRPEYT